MRLHLMGRHAHRIPLAYPAYRALAKGIEFVSVPAEADFIVFGFVIDVAAQADAIAEALRRNPGISLVVLSEEPLWDTMWTPDYRNRHQHVVIGERKVAVHLLNHFTTRIFDFDRFPYFVTTDDRYFARYQALFSRNAARSEQEWLSHWAKASVSAAFVAERRLDRSFSFELPALDTWGLCEYRTRVAAAVTAPDALRIGQGWDGTNERRQALPDWHLDKLATLDGRARFVSSLENTHQPAYLTEKLFDAYAVQGIPLYYASPKHRVNSIVPKGSFFNLFGQTPEDAAIALQSPHRDRVLATAYREAQLALQRLFTKADLYIEERARLIAAIAAELRHIQTQGR